MTDFPGYRQPSPEMVKLVTEIKQEEERILRYIEAVDIDLDPRWRAVALTHLQEGTMALIRSVLRPGRLALPEDSPKVEPVPEPEETRVPVEDFYEPDINLPNPNQMS